MNLAGAQVALQLGVTNDILGRVGRHRERIGSKFTARYRVHQPV
jgi:predicted GIY-YIG superfamily endonuclease